MSVWKYFLLLEMILMTSIKQSYQELISIRSQFNKLLETFMRLKSEYSVAKIVIKGFLPHFPFKLLKFWWFGENIKKTFWSFLWDSSLSIKIYLDFFFWKIVKEIWNDNLKVLFENPGGVWKKILERVFCFFLLENLKALYVIKNVFHEVGCDKYKQLSKIWTSEF